MNKVVMITGGSKGIGKAVAMKLSDLGHKVIVCSRTKKDMDSLSIRASVKTEFCDVKHYDHVKKLFENVMNEYGRIDVLINCAGILGPMGHFEDNDINAWVDAMDINLIGTVNCVHQALPIMKKQHYGRIITFCGGGVGGSKLEPGFSAYSTSKFAVAGFVESIAKEVSFFGIQINAISPGPIDTDMARQRWVKGNPPDKVVDLILFLINTEKEVNGKVISAVWDDYQNVDYSKESLFNLRRISE
jgi:NAD(P)-dependent dehydrogenase (short-subunit alcohol dehydrogenase family)